LDRIRTAKAITIGRGSLIVSQPCIHVELEPFGPTLPSVPKPWSYRPHTPKADLGIDPDGAYVEFDLPDHLPLLNTSGGMLGPRNTGEILTDVPLSLEGLNPKFVKVRRHFWELWRTRAE
jgi:hypothetical protein